MKKSRRIPLGIRCTILVLGGISSVFMGLACGDDTGGSGSGGGGGGSSECWPNGTGCLRSGQALADCCSGYCDENGSCN